MARPQNDRWVNQPPLYTSFKPCGIPAVKLEQESLSLDEYEAIRLADYEGLNHEEAGKQMEISRSTFSRLIERARRKIASSIIDGKLLSINGGSFHFRKNILECESCGAIFQGNFDNNISNCPKCKSSKLISHANKYGHGHCCKKKKLNN